MTKEYIERGALIEEVESLTMTVTGMREGKNVLREALTMYREAVLSEIKEAPAADVVEVKHGRWEWREEWETHPEMRSCDLISCGWYCTECGIELGEYLTQKTGQHIILDDDTCKPRLTNCPNCGAKMDGE